MYVIGPDKIKLAEIYISFTAISQIHYLTEKQKIPHGRNSSIVQLQNHRNRKIRYPLQTNT